MYKRSLLLSLFIFLSLFSFAQQDRFFDPLPIGHYWGISVTPGIVNKAKIDGRKDKYHLKSQYQFGGDAMIRYYYHFEKNYTVSIAVGGEAIGTDFDYNIDKNYFTPPTESNISNDGAGSREFYFNARAEIELERQWYRKTDNYWVAAVGTSILYSPESISSSAGFLGGTRPDFFTEDIDINNHGIPWFNFHISGGQGWLLKSGDMFQAKLKLNVSPTNFVKSHYRFIVGNEPDEEGVYKVSCTYLGLSFAYVFTKKRGHREEQ